jgi:hypothetical protein
LPEGPFRDTDSTRTHCEATLRNLVTRTLLFLFTVSPLPQSAHAQQASPVGVVTAAANATIGNGNVSEGTTVFSGELLKTSDQGHLSVQSGSLQIALGENSSARVFRNLNRTIVELERGTLAYSSKGMNENLTLFALDIRFAPQTSLPVAGQISILSRCDVSVTATRGTIEVTSGRETKTVQETKSYRVLSDFGVDYRDSWQPVLSDYPDFPRDAQYHHSHGHVACVAAATPIQNPVSALAEGHFREIIGGAVGLITGYVLHEAFESPDRP